MSGRVALFFFVTLILVASVVGGADAQGRRGKHRRSFICGNPTARCPTNDEGFQPYDLRFDLPVSFGIYETQPFYAVILKSMRDPDCNARFSEEERMEAQRLFPHRKVFAS